MDAIDELIVFKNKMSQMFDSKARIGMAIYEEIEKIEKKRKKQVCKCGFGDWIELEDGRVACSHCETPKP